MLESGRANGVVRKERENSKEGEMSMFKRFTNGCVRVVNRWLPDPFLFAVILTIVVFIGAMIGTQQGPLELVWAWGGRGTTGDTSTTVCSRPPS